MRPRGRICGIDRTALLVNVVQVVVALYLTCSDSQVRDEQKDRAQCNEDKTDYFEKVVCVITLVSNKQKQDQGSKAPSGLSFFYSVYLSGHLSFYPVYLSGHSSIYTVNLSGHLSFYPVYLLGHSSF